MKNDESVFPKILDPKTTYQIFNFLDVLYIYTESDEIIFQYKTNYF